MAEYWKSTPKYWCKFCEIFVRDTTLEKKQHESTPKHQGNIQRSLRNLHKDKEREDREKQRAKAEVERLNGIVSGKGSQRPGSSAPIPGAAHNAPGPIQKRATVEDRQKQIEQLVALGVAVPDEIRKDMALQGGWSTVSETPIYTNSSHIKEEDEDTKPTVGSFGVRKRKLDEDEEEAEQQLTQAAKRNWGSSLKSYPGAKGKVDNDDLDALLAGAATKKATSEETKAEETEDTVPGLKKEETTETIAAVPEAGEPSTAVKQEEGTSAEAPIVFKKRKGKR